MIQCCGVIQHPCTYVLDSPQTSDRHAQSQFSTDLDRETQNIIQSGDNCESASGQDTGTEMEEDDVTKTWTDDITSPAVPHDGKGKH